MKSIFAFAVLLIAGPLTAVSDDLEDSFQKLKDAEARKDAAEVKRLAHETCELARRAIAKPAPENEEEKEAWTQRIPHLRDIEVHTEYALYAMAAQSKPAVAIDLIVALEEQNPKSRYLDEAYGTYFYALHQTGGAAKILPTAEKALANFPNNEDLLLVVADNAMNRKQTDRALAYSERLTAALEKHPKPEGMSAGDWERKRTAALGRSRWIAGLMHSEKTQYYEADKDLRAALPLIQGNDAMLAPALFYLGIANYQLGSTMRSRAQMLEAARFSEEASKIKGPLAQQAWHNAVAMKAEAAKLR